MFPTALSSSLEASSKTQRLEDSKKRLELVAEIEIPVPARVRVALLVIVKAIKEIFHAGLQVYSGMDRDDTSKIQCSKLRCRDDEAGIIGSDRSAFISGRRKEPNTARHSQACRADHSVLGSPGRKYAKHVRRACDAPVQETVVGVHIQPGQRSAANREFNSLVNFLAHIDRLLTEAGVRQCWALVFELGRNSGIFNRVIHVAAEKIDLHHCVERKNARVTKIPVPRVLRLQGWVWDGLSILVGIPVLERREMTLFRKGKE